MKFMIYKKVKNVKKNIRTWRKKNE